MYSPTWVLETKILCPLERNYDAYILPLAPADSRVSLFSVVRDAVLRTPSLAEPSHVSSSFFPFFFLPVVHTFFFDSFMHACMHSFIHSSIPSFRFSFKTFETSNHKIKFKATSSASRLCKRMILNDQRPVSNSPRRRHKKI